MVVRLEVEECNWNGANVIVGQKGKYTCVCVHKPEMVCVYFFVTNVTETLCVCVCVWPFQEMTVYECKACLSCIMFVHHRLR